ncbi:MAG: permease-like cell division protein FtsX [Burkholderiaceae bacterium]|nr:permease-like cell division protein FtsX [Burkholderiaceae bacterium]
MNWLRDHWLALRAALTQAGKRPGSFAFNVGVIALALVLPLAGLTLLENLRPVARDLAVDPEISVFLSTEVARDRVQAIGPEIRAAAQRNGVPVTLEFVDRDRALDAMKARAGLADVVSALGSNPLPDAWVVRVGGAEPAGPAQIEKLAADLQRVQGVETVQLDAAWVRRLAALLQLAASVLVLLAVTLCGVVVAVVFNTIRLQVYTQQEEIGVARLVGATDAFVARPFYYMGGLLGLCAGALALLAVFGGLMLLNVSVGELAKLYGSGFLLAPLDAASVAMLLAGSAALGVLGAALSVRRALRAAGQ